MVAKAADAFRTISEVSGWLDTPAHVLRFWESKFPQVKPVKRAGGRRYYRPEDMTLLGGIKALLHEQGMTIKGVQKLLREKGTRHVAAMSPPLGQFDGAGEVIELEPDEDLTVLGGPEPGDAATLPDPAGDAAPPAPGWRAAFGDDPAPDGRPERPAAPPRTMQPPPGHEMPPQMPMATVITLPPVRPPSPVPRGLLPLLIAADSARLRAQSRRIIPHLRALQALSAQMAPRDGPGGS